MLSMADGPVANLPPGLDAYAGYVNKSGIGITYPAVVARFPDAQHLSITTNGSPAMCADVESGAMINWLGYRYGYCSVSNVNALIAKYGRPKRLWTAHYNGTAHICSPKCWPGLVTVADGTQWVDHGGWDESLLEPDFFGIIPTPPAQEDDMQLISTSKNGAGTTYVIAADLSHKQGIPTATDVSALQATGFYTVVKLDDQLIAAIPGS